MNCSHAQLLRPFSLLKLIIESDANLHCIPHSALHDEFKIVKGNEDICSARGLQNASFSEKW
jgi:hypothetical protein